MSYKLDIDQGADKLGSRFFAKILNDYATFNLQLPITSVHLVHMKEVIIQTYSYTRLMIARKI